MNVTINGETEELARRAHAGRSWWRGRMRTDKGVAAAVDGAVAPRSTWSRAGAAATARRSSC